jgi:hypothetical protein
MTLKPLAGVLLSLLIILIIRYPVYNYFQVEPAPVGSRYIAMVNDLAGVYFDGGNLPEETERYLRSVVDLEQLETVYSSYRANYDYYRPALDQTRPLDLLKMYGKTALSNPLLIVNSILCRLDLYWNITTGKEAYIGTMIFREISNWEQFTIHFYRKNNILTDFFDLASKGTVYLSPILIMFWRFGFWLVLLFTGFLFALQYKLRRSIFLAIPIMANLFSLALSAGWLDYRYGWSIFITVPVVLGVMILPWNRSEADGLR